MTKRPSNSWRSTGLNTKMTDTPKLKNESLQKMYEDSTFHLQQELWFQELLKEPNQATIENCTIAKKALAALRNEVARLEDELEKWELFSSEGYGL